MKNVAFISPDGARSAVTPELLDRLASEPPSYWMRNAGSASFERDDGSTLILVQHPSDGVHLERVDGPGEEYFVPCVGEERESVTLVSGGEPFEVPKCSLLSVETAFQLVRSFCEGAELDDHVEWLALSEFDE